MRKLLNLLGVTAICAGFVLAGCSKKSSENAEEEGGATQQKAATPLDMSTVGTITGKVDFSGAKPTTPVLHMDAEPYCVSQHSTPVHSQDIVVNPNNTLQYALVYISDGLGDRTFDTPKTPVVLDQKGCMYQPHVVGIQAGQPFEVVSSDKTTHNIHPMPKDNREWNQSQAPGSPPIDKTWARPEFNPPIPVKCNVHPWMKSYIAVFPNPYFAVTGDDGTFTIKNVPPGTYTVTVWQEKLGEQKQQVTVGAKESKNVDFTYKS
jgi:plastocyanin